MPGRLIELLRRAFRRVWSARGGGLYATGVFLTFFWLETITLVREFTSSDDTGDFVAGQLLDIVLRFSVVSLQNTVYALIWPLALFERYGPYWAGGMLVTMYVVFAGLIKKPLERWLFDSEAHDTGRQEAVRNNGAGE